MSVKSFMSRPTPYVIWALVVVASLYGTYFGDPYLFGFSTIGLCWLTVAMGVVGIAICIFSKTIRARDRAFILVALAVAAAAIIKAFRTLATFNWA